jgi:hypothetical protein
MALQRLEVVASDAKSAVLSRCLVQQMRREPPHLLHPLNRRETKACARRRRGLKTCPNAFA